MCPVKNIKFLIGILATLILISGVYFVLRGENALLAHPKGVVARKELDLMIRSILLMLIVVVPTLIGLFVIAWRYRSKNAGAKYDPEHASGAFSETLLWVVPSVVVGVLSVITWYAAHELDPYRPLKSEVKPITIQVVALDWKWLFIYPEQGVATLNFVQFPDNTPIHFTLTADETPMNSFWVPELSGQIYCMTGMVTPLHVMADGPGVYTGRAAEINGRGLADMTFVAKSMPKSDFDGWIAQVEQSPDRLTDSVYEELLKPSTNLPTVAYSFVERDLFMKIVMKYMHPATPKS